MCDLDYVSDLVTTIQGIGLVVGAGLFGQLSDLLGRKFSYFLANSILLIGGKYFQSHGHAARLIENQNSSVLTSLLSRFGDRPRIYKYV